MWSAAAVLAVLLTATSAGYGYHRDEHFAVDRFGPSQGLHPPYSGPNALSFTDRPPESVRNVLAVGIPAPRLTGYFDSCREVGRLDNGVGADNEEQQQVLLACTGRTASWNILWPQLQHYD